MRIISPSIPSINNFFKAHPVDKMTPTQKKMVADISQNKVIKAQIINLITKTRSLSLSMEWIQFATSLGFLTEDESSLLVQNKVEALFKRPLMITDKDLICSTQFSRNPQISAAIIGARKLNQFDIEALKCLGVSDVKVQVKMAKALRDSDVWVRAAAARALGAIKPQDKEVSIRLAKALKDSDPDVRFEAARALGAIKPQDKEVVMRLTEALKDANPSVCFEAASALGAIKPQDKEVVMRVTEFLKDSNPEVRYSAARALGAIKPQDREVSIRLADALNDSDPKVRTAAAEALEEIAKNE